MVTDPGPVVQRARLTAELQRIRRDAGKTQEEVARALDWSPSKLIRIEGGNVGISTTDLQALLRYCGVTDEARTQHLVHLARGARQRGWWDPYKNDLNDNAFCDYLGYEAGASIIRWFSPMVIPGLLQTEEYARALTIEFVPSNPIAEAVIEVRLLRQQKLLDQADPPRQHYVLDEAVISRRVGGQVDPAIMPRQLEHLLQFADHPKVTIEVIPFDKGSHFGMRGEFEVLGFEDGPEGVLYLENGRARGRDLTITDSDEVATFLEAFDHLRQLALSKDESADFIRTAAERMKSESS